MGAGMKKRKGHFDKYEFLRRQIAKDLRSLFQHRYGAGFPDDDAGREDLEELLKPISLAPFHHERKMRKQIKRTASWMSDDEAEQLIAEICDKVRIDNPLPLSDNSGQSWNLAHGRLSAYDPKRTSDWPHVCRSNPAYPTSPRAPRKAPGLSPTTLSVGLAQRTRELFRATCGQSISTPQTTKMSVT